MNYFSHLISADTTSLLSALYSPMVHPSSSNSDSGDSSSNKDGSSKMERPKKKVEWSSNLNPTEPPAPEDRSPMWDSEADHLLSYFLGDSSQNSIASPPTRFATTGGSSSTDQSHSISAFSNSDKPLHPYHKPRMPGFGGQSPDTMSYDDEPIHPPTPSNQYYFKFKPKAKAKSTRPPTHPASPQPMMSISETKDPNHHSVMSMEASLLSGSDDAHSHTMADMSSMSPAAMIGDGHEPMMLPSSTPPQFLSSQSISHQNQPYHRQSHIEWLQQINAMAKHHTSTSDSSGTQQTQPIVAPPPSQQQQQHGVAPAHSVAMSVAVHGYPALGTPLFYSHLTQIQQQPQGESEEKRARRLERNRESARKSRRRKKERLSRLEEKVAGLHAKIEAERRVQINSMDSILLQFQKERIAQFKKETEDVNNINADWKERLTTLVQMTGPNCPVRRSVVHFQYRTLRQMLLPRYQKFMMWLTLHDEQYFLIGKEQHAQGEGKQTLRVSSCKISSKQVGDELVNGRKLEDGTFEPPPTTADGEKANQTAHAFDAPRMWPLLCFELSVSVDQEERFLQAYKRVRRSENLQKARSQIAAATRMASSLKEAVLFQSHSTAMRSEEFHTGILTPKQAVLYQDWLATNRDRCREALNKRKDSKGSWSPNSPDRQSLLDVCRKLEEVLKISKKQNP